MSWFYEETIKNGDKEIISYMQQYHDHLYKQNKDEIDLIIKMLISTDKFDEFKNIKREDLYLEHFGLALWIRNNTSHDSDDSSNILVECIHEIINRDDFNLEKWKEEN